MNAQIVQKNIRILLAMEFLHGAMFIMPIITLYFLDHGLSIAQVILIQIIFAIAMSFMEVPSGYFADKWGRKTSIIIGSVLSFLGFFGYIFADSFWEFLVVEIVLGIGMSFLSGADSALLYDSLKEAGREDEYKKYEGHRFSLQSASGIIAGIIGAYAAAVNSMWPFILEAIAFFFLIPLAVFLKEPPQHKQLTGESPWKEIVKITKYSLHGHIRLKWLLLFGGLTSSSTLTFVWLAQPYYTAIGVPIEYFGWISAIAGVLTIVASQSAVRVEKKIGEKLSLLTILLLPVVAYGALGLSGSIGMLVFANLFHLSRGIQRPIMNDYINRHVESRVRATVLSVGAMTGRFWFIVLGFPLGSAADLWGIHTSLLVSAAAFGTLGGAFLWRLLRAGGMGERGKV
jgi:MFS family permease